MESSREKYFQLKHYKSITIDGGPVPQLMVFAIINDTARFFTIKWVEVYLKNKDTTVHFFAERSDFISERIVDLKATSATYQDFIVADWNGMYLHLNRSVTIKLDW